MSQAGDRRFLLFLALSMALHALWLAVPMRNRTSATPEPLNVHLMPATPVEKSVVVTRHQPRGNSASATREAAVASETPPEAASPPPATINLDSAFATARSMGLDAPARPAPDAPRPLTVESAIAKAAQADDVVETRGAGGEYVTKSRHSRCVTPIYVPHFLEGKTMLTQCEALKG